MGRENQCTIAVSAMKIIEQNIALARNKPQPTCQDTGSITFYVDCPLGFDRVGFEPAVREAVKLATKKGCSVRASWTRLPARTTAPMWGPVRPPALVPLVQLVEPQPREHGRG
jgi:fumarate hydratase, class I